VLFELEIAEPGHGRQSAVEEGVQVMPETGQAWVIEGHQAAAGERGTVDGQGAQTAAREVGLQDQGIVAGAQDDAVNV
jgi:hypothetical protein